MIALGAETEKMGTMDIDLLFLSRLRLLIIMLKAYLKGYPIGRYRLEGMKHNALIVGDEAVYFWGLAETSSADATIDQPFNDNTFGMDREVYEHIKMLTLLIEKIKLDKKPDKRMVSSAAFHLDYLNRRLSPDRNLSEMQFLKVA